MKSKKSKGRRVGKKNRGKKRGPPKKLENPRIGSELNSDQLLVAESKPNPPSRKRDIEQVTNKIFRIIFPLLLRIVLRAVFITAEIFRSHQRLIIAATFVQYSEDLFSFLGIINPLVQIALHVAGSATLIWELWGFLKKLVLESPRDR